jgi:hypothetical protein
MHRSITKLRTISVFDWKALEQAQDRCKEQLSAVSSEVGVSPHLSPGSSVYWSNLNWMSTTEVETLALFAIISNEIQKNDILRCEVYLGLERAIRRNKEIDYVRSMLLLRLLDERLRRRLPLYENRQRVLLRHYSYRRIKGLFSDRSITFGLQKRLKARVVKPRVPKDPTTGCPLTPNGVPFQTSRHRGYRDHGSARPRHLWKPRFDLRLVLQQNWQEAYEELTSKTDTIFLKRPFKEVFRC